MSQKCGSELVIQIFGRLYDYDQRTDGVPVCGIGL